jgi:hypothetical protein
MLIFFHIKSAKIEEVVKACLCYSLQTVKDGKGIGTQARRSIMEGGKGGGDLAKGLKCLLRVPV